MILLLKEVHDIIFKDFYEGRVRAISLNNKILSTSSFIHLHTYEVPSNSASIMAGVI